MHRLSCFVTIALGFSLAAACGDDTGGSAGTGGAGTGGSGTTTAASTGSGDGGAAATTGVATATASTGGGDFQSLIDACNELDATLAPLGDEAACATPYATQNCGAIPGTYPGCEAETEVWFECWEAEATAADCACDADDRTVCTSPAACQDEYNSFTGCAFPEQ